MFLEVLILERKVGILQVQTPLGMILGKQNLVLQTSW